MIHNNDNTMDQVSNINGLNETSMNMVVVDTGGRNEEIPQTHPRDNRPSQYGSASEKKPKWWRRLAGRRGTKVQRAAMDRMKSYFIPKVPYGTFLNIQQSSVSLLSTSKLEIWLEIGFGNGVNLLKNALNHPDRFYFGAEMHQPGVGNLCLRIEDEQNKSKTVNLSSKEISCKMDKTIHYDHDQDSSMDKNLLVLEHSTLLSCSNIRIYAGDGTKLLRSLPQHSMTSILITFPDPFANTNQQKWRIVQNDIIDEMRRVLIPEGGRFYLATDVEEYDIWTRQLMHHNNENSCNDMKRQWVEMIPPPPRKEWLPVVSQYEEKGLNEGRRTWMQCWESTKYDNSQQK